MNPSVGKVLMIIGGLVVVAGALIYFFGNRLGFLGRLPGDIRVEKEGGGFYFPITTCILLSLLLTLLVRIIQWLLK
jgi:hypothetical protein